MIRSADVRNDSEARRWEARLNREWPQRTQVAAWIIAQIGGSKANSPRVVELACGAGYLAEAIKGKLPGVRYCGFDLSLHLLDYARHRLKDNRGQPDREGEIEFRVADLVRDDWTEQLVRMGWSGKVDAVVSIQALHDMGGLEQQAQVLRQARELLRPGGLLAYGDLLFNAEKPHSSRFAAAQHEEMLRDCGYTLVGTTSADCSGEDSCPDGKAAVRFGDFGCFAGYI